VFRNIQTLGIYPEESIHTQNFYLCYRGREITVYLSSIFN